MRLELVPMFYSEGLIEGAYTYPNLFQTNLWGVAFFRGVVFSDIVCFSLAANASFHLFTNSPHLCKNQLTFFDPFPSWTGVQTIAIYPTYPELFFLGKMTSFDQHLLRFPDLEFHFKGIQILVHLITNEKRKQFFAKSISFIYLSQFFMSEQRLR